MIPVSDRGRPLTYTELLASLVTVIVLLICISGESFWIDEVTTGTFASRPTWKGFWSALETTGSEMQMPLFSHYMWVWGRLFGSGELSLRCANIPWMFLLVAGTLQLLAQNRVSRVAVLLLVSPLVCFQMNEARPYVMTLATSVFSLYTLQCIIDDARQGVPALPRHVWFFVLSVWACVATSMLNLFLLPALGVFAFAMLRGQLSAFLRGHVRAFSVLSAGLVILLAYFAWTILGGHGGQKLPFTLTNLAYALYEWLGFGGLGAPRNILREIGSRAAWAQYYPTLLLGIAAWVLIMVAGLASWRQAASSRTTKALVLGGKTGGLALIAAAVLAPASIWGRHFLFLWPIYWIGLARWLQPGSRKLSRVALAFLLLVFLFSSGQQRFNPDHAKDHFREVVGALRLEMGGYDHLPWVWTAYPKALLLYGGEFVDRNNALVTDHSTGRLGMVKGDRWSAAEIETWGDDHPEYLLVLHRPDSSDPDRGWRAAARASDSRLLWERGNMRVYLVRVPSAATD